MVACVVAPAVVVIVVLFSTAKTFESSGVVALNQDWFERVAPGDTSAEARAVAVAERVEAARSARFHPSGEGSEPYRYVVQGDPIAGEVRITAYADSAGEALAAADAITEEFARGTNLQVPDAAEVSVESQPNGRPVSPDFVRLVLLALLGGVVLAVGVAFALERRGSPVAAPGSEPPDSFGRPSDRPAAALALRAAILVCVAPLLVAALMGIQRVWALRPSTDERTEARLACLAGWLDGIPEGSRVYPEPGPASTRDIFWISRTAELAFPRLTPVVTPGEADYLVDIVPSTDQGSCAGFRLELTSL